MHRKSAEALLATCLSILAGQARSQVSPCTTEPNAPLVGIRYTCQSTSSHTTDHPDATRLATNAWRTRITARRQGAPDVFDVIVDSLSSPPGDPSVQAVLANANLSVGGTGYVVSAPALLSSSVAAVVSEPLSNVANRTTIVTQIVVSSSATSRVLCVGDLGDLALPPPPLPEAPGCAPGAWKVELRRADGSVSDRLEDTHTHAQTDAYSTLLVTGDLTTSHYEVVARPSLPCTASPVFIPWCGPRATHYDCTSSSHHTTVHEIPDSFLPSERYAWSTRITGRLGGTIVFDRTVNGLVEPFSDPAVESGFDEGRRAITAAAGSPLRISGPMLLERTAGPVTAVNLANVTTTNRISVLLKESSGDVCVGDLGDLAKAPEPCPPYQNWGCAVGPPCAATATVIHLSQDPTCYPPVRDFVEDRHVHTQTDIYLQLLFTGWLTTSHYEFVVEGAGPASTLTIPIVLSSAGLGGSAFTSELTLTNRGTTDAQIAYAFTPAFGGTAGTAMDTLQAGRQRVIPNAIAYLQGLGVTNPGPGGTLRITFSGLSSPDAVSATVRTTTAVPGGRAGLAYAGLPPSKLLSSPVYLRGLRQTSTDRSNVAVVNAGASGDGDVTLRLTVFSGDPANPQSKALPDVTLPPGGFTQISGILASNGLSLSSGYVKVERVSGSAPFYAYAVINDQITSDGSFVEPVAANLASPIASTTLPALVETPAYETELILTNLSSSPRTLRFTWVSASLTGGQTSFSIPLLPGEQQILPSFVHLLRDRGIVTNPAGPTFAGALFASDASGDLRGVSLAARVTSGLAGGRLGVFLPAFPSGSEATTAAWLFGLQQNAETRSNLALVNTGSADASPSTFRIDLFDGTTGAKSGSLVATVPAKGFVQIDRILANYAPGTSSGYALVTRISGNGPFVAYAVLNDGAEPGQRSGDGAFVAANLPAP